MARPRGAGRHSLRWSRHPPLLRQRGEALLAAAGCRRELGRCRGHGARYGWLRHQTGTPCLLLLRTTRWSKHCARARKLLRQRTFSRRAQTARSTVALTTSCVPRGGHRESHKAANSAPAQLVSSPKSNLTKPNPIKCAPRRALPPRPRAPPRDPAHERDISITTTAQNCSGHTEHT